ncbi:MAG: type II toxin-antitoxin system RelE/ParE family toxin [Burkholderiales bacterium]
MRFRKQYLKADKKIRTAFAQTIELFVEEPDHPILRNHLLREKFAGYRSINITDDYRAVFRETKSGDRTTITFHMIGTHDEPYGENS